jgi:hypothetical protein
MFFQDKLLATIIALEASALHPTSGDICRSLSLCLDSSLMRRTIWIVGGGCMMGWWRPSVPKWPEGWNAAGEYDHIELDENLRQSAKIIL